MSLDRLRSFIEVYRTRSMGKAATALSLTQPAVSGQIAALERELGAPLFVRSRRGVSPTAVADSLAQDVAAALDRLDAAMTERLARTATISGLLHLGAPAELFSAFGARMIAALTEAPLRIQVHLGGRSFLYDSLMEGTIDLAVTASAPPGRSFGRSELHHERLLLVAPPALRDLLRGRRLDAALLAAQPFIAYDQDLPLIQRYFESLFGARCEATPRVVVPDLRSVGAVCAAVPSWTVLPDYLAQPYLDSGRLVLLQPEKEVTNPFFLVWRRTALRTPRVAFAKETLLKVWQI